MAKVTKTELARAISKRTGDTQKSCDDMIVAMCNIIIEALLKGDSVQIRNFCTFECVEYAERVTRNPSTGKRQYFPAIRIPKCRIAEIVKDAVKSKRTELGRDLVT